MPPGRQSNGVVRFGPFQVDLEEGVLRKHDVRVRLQAQPFQILAALLENPGRIVTREELSKRLWPDGTFVDFEHGLNAAVTRLRQALADAAEEPRYIETVAKRGYRFIGEVQSSAVDAISEPSPVSAKGRDEPGSKSPKLIAAAAAVLSAVLLVSYLVLSRDEQIISHPVPLTTFHGSEVNPALSPDGRHVAFAWNGEKQDNFDIYVLPIGSSAPRRLTADPAHDVSPAWSPDGRTIAFLRHLGGDRAAVMLLASAGGPEHRIAETRNDEMRLLEEKRSSRLPCLSWSPDGHWVAASHRELSEPHEGIYLFSVTGEKRSLTTAPLDSHGDHLPAFSPDGRKLAFCRLLGYTSSEIYLRSLDMKNEPGDEVLRLTSNNRWSTNPAWINDGREILYLLSPAPNALQRREIRIANASGRSSPERIVAIENEVWQVSVSASRRLVYSRRRQDVNIRRGRIPARGEPPDLAELIISSTRGDRDARYSPDGSKISFLSARSGFEEVWISRADGSNETRMTSFGGPLIGPPAWSPDGQRLVFHTRRDGQADLFVMPAAGGSPTRLTHHPSDETTPVYSRDGRSIYFTSVRSGRMQVWKMPGAGGDAVQVTTNGGRRPQESLDGKALFYLSETGDEIRQVPTAGGNETPVVAPVCAESGYALTTEGLLYPAPSGEGCEFRLLDLSTGRSRPILRTASRPVGMVVGVSPDEKYFLFSEAETPSVDLMLVENFRPRPLR